MKKKKKKKASRRVTKMDRLTAAVIQTHTHASTEEILRKRDILTFESVVLDQEIVGLRARLADATSRRVRVEATLLGLGLTIGKR